MLTPFTPHFVDNTNNATAKMTHKNVHVDKWGQVGQAIAQISSELRVKVMAVTGRERETRIRPLQLLDLHELQRELSGRGIACQNPRRQR